MRLVEERSKRKLSQLEASKEIGISQSMLAMMESGQRSGGDQTKQKIADYYGVPVGYLFFDEPTTESNNTNIKQKV